MYGSLENIKIVTLAPELDKGFEVTQALTAMGITVSVGHSMANVEDGERAVESGATLITHLFNAMLPVITVIPYSVIALITYFFFSSIIGILVW